MNTFEETRLLKKLSLGVLDGLVGDIWTCGRSTCWREIKNGIPTEYKQGPGGKFFNNIENERFPGVLHLIQKWVTDEQKLEFLQKYGWLMNDEDVVAYSAKFKPQK